MEDNHNFISDGRGPQYFYDWKTPFIIIPANQSLVSPGLGLYPGRGPWKKYPASWHHLDYLRFYSELQNSSRIIYLFSLIKNYLFIFILNCIEIYSWWYREIVPSDWLFPHKSHPGEYTSSTVSKHGAVEIIQNVKMRNERQKNILITQFIHHVRTVVLCQWEWQTLALL